MLRHESKGLSWLEFELFSKFDTIRHGFFLRSGGVSKGPYASLNCSSSIGDDPKAVNINRSRICEALGVVDLLSLQQIHSDRIVEATMADIPADGFSCNKPGKGLMTLCADCQTALFYDPRLQVIANVHVGWRGSIANLYAKTVQHLIDLYGCHPQDLLVGIGPSLGPQHAEFINYRKELPKSFWKYQSQPNYFDFWQISRAQLEENGIPSANIEIASLSTYGSPEEFFSYRHQGITGRHAAVIVLKEPP